jgi:hypothetical protein
MVMYTLRWLGSVRDLAAEKIDRRGSALALHLKAERGHGGRNIHWHSNETKLKRMTYLNVRVSYR